MMRLWFWGILGAGVLVLGSFGMIQKIRADNLTDRIDQLQTDIKNIRAAQALTDQLRKDNAILNKDQEDIRNDLRDAQGYSDPLSPDVVRILDRLRSGTTTP